MKGSLPVIRYQLFSTGEMAANNESCISKNGGI